MILTNMSTKKKLKFKGDLDSILNKHNLNSNTFNKKSKKTTPPLVVEVVKKPPTPKPKPQPQPTKPQPPTPKPQPQSTKQQPQPPQPQSTKQQPLPQQPKPHPTSPKQHPKQPLPQQPKPHPTSPKQHPKQPSQQPKPQPTSPKQHPKQPPPQQPKPHPTSPKQHPKQPPLQQPKPPPQQQPKPHPTSPQYKMNSLNNQPVPTNTRQSTSHSKTKPIIIDPNYTILGESSKPLSKQKQKEIDTFLNKKFVANNKLPSYRRKHSPINNTYNKQLQSIDQDKTYSHTNRLSKINQLIGKAAPSSIQVIKKNYPNDNTVDTTHVITNPINETNNSNETIETNETNNDQDDIPESLKVLQKKRDFLLLQKRKEMEKISKKKSQLKKIHQRKQEIELMYQIEKDKKDLALLRNQQQKLDQITHLESKRIKQELENTQQKINKKSHQSSSSSSASHQTPPSPHQSSPSPHQPSSPHQTKKYNYEGIDISQLVKQNLTKSNKLSSSSNKKTKKRVKFDLTKNKTLKFDKSLAIKEDPTPEDPTPEDPIPENLIPEDPTQSQFYIGESFDINKEKETYLYRDSKECPILATEYPINNDNHDDNTQDNHDNNSHIHNHNHYRKKTFLTQNINPRTHENINKTMSIKPIIHMSDNDKKRWLMRKYGFSNIKNLTQDGTHLIYTILNELPITMGIITK